MRRYSNGGVSAAASVSASRTRSSWNGDRPQAGSVAAASPRMAKAWQRQPPQSISRRSQERQGSGIHFVPQVTFTLPDGTVITFLDKDSAAAQLPYVIRGTVSVNYDPENPQDAHIGNRNWIWINIAVLLSAAGLWFFRGFLNTALDPE